MTEEVHANQEKSTFDADRLLELLPQLTTNQLRYLVARQEYATDGEAAQAIGMKPNTIYKWPKLVDEALHLMSSDGVLVAREMRRRSLPKAMAVKVAGLDSDDEKLRQGVATEIIEWELGKPMQRNELSGPNGQAVQYTIRFDANGSSNDKLQHPPAPAA